MEALKAYFERTGRKQADLAAQLGVNYVTVYYWAAGKRRPTPQMARKLNEATGIPLSKIRPDIWPRVSAEPPAAPEAAG